MTLEKLIALLQTVCPETYELAAPQGVKRCIVAHTYTNGRSLYGNDQNLFDIEKVQLDILTQQNSDTLLLDVCELLRAWCITYTLETIHEYDDEWNALRSIVQLELI